MTGQEFNFRGIPWTKEEEGMLDRVIQSSGGYYIRRTEQAWEKVQKAFAAGGGDRSVSAIKNKAQKLKAVEDGRREIRRGAEYLRQQVQGVELSTFPSVERPSPPVTQKVPFDGLFSGGLRERVEKAEAKVDRLAEALDRLCQMAGFTLEEVLNA